MKIVVTGSLGHISKPLAAGLIKKGHTITVISSSADKQAAIEALGATAAIGSLADIGFITKTFTGADAVYTMVPPANYFDQNLDLPAYCHQLGHNYVQAIKASGVKRVIHLSSIGADLDKGTGIILAHHDVEVMFNKLDDVDITFMRPTSFYYNLYGYAGMIKQAGFIAANYGANDMIPWVSPYDIADAIVDEFETTASHRKIRYVASEELTGTQSAKILGEAIGKPDLQWIVITKEEATKGLIDAGMQPSIAAGVVEMYGGLHDGTFAADYFANRPAVMGQVKLADFAKEFAQSFK